MDIFIAVCNVVLLGISIYYYIKTGKILREKEREFNNLYRTPVDANDDIAQKEANALGIAVEFNGKIFRPKARGIPLTNYGMRACGVCNKFKVPRGVDWPFWASGAPVCLDCEPDYTAALKEIRAEKAP